MLKTSRKKHLTHCRHKFKIKKQNSLCQHFFHWQSCHPIRRGWIEIYRVTWSPSFLQLSLWQNKKKIMWHFYSQECLPASTSSPNLTLTPCASIKNSLLLTHACMNDLMCENEVGGCRGAAGFGQWASNGHMGLSPSLHNNSAGPCGYIPVLDIFSKNIPSLQPHSCKIHWNHFLSTSETESNEAYKASQHTRRPSNTLF